MTMALQSWLSLLLQQRAFSLENLHTVCPHFENQMPLSAFTHRRQQLKLIYMFRAIKQIYLIHGEHHLTFSIWTSLPKRFTNLLK